jgi:hypothetical protein
VTVTDDLNFTAAAARAAVERRSAVIDGARVDACHAAVVARIRQACELGQRSIRDPFSGLPHGTPLVYAALKVRFQRMGYTYTDHADPDPGHPCSLGAYSTLSW